MQDDDKKHQEQFDASLPLPLDNDQAEDSEGSKKPKAQETNAAAADLIRKKLDTLYASEPDAKEEIEEIEELEPANKLSRHQQFIYELTSSGKSLSDVQAAWHEYYASLNDEAKHEVWHEFYSAQGADSHYKTEAPKLKKVDKEAKEISVNQQHRLSPAKHLRRLSTSPRATKVVHRSSSLKQHLKSLAFGLSVGCLVLLILLFGLFNERIIAPFIQPSRNISNIPIISTSATVGPNPEIIIPKINVEIPVVYDVSTTNQDDVENALENGVVHYADTALPGQNGNAVIVGHSSNNIFNPGKYKFAFVLLSHLDNGDTFYLTKDGKRYTYQVYKKDIVNPNDVSVLGLNDKAATVTLITCDPPGTSINRLVVVGQQIDPNPATNSAASSTNKAAVDSQVIPGNSPTLWSRIVKWLES